jgi:hypothetical protein
MKISLPSYCAPTPNPSPQRGRGVCAAFVAAMCVLAMAGTMSPTARAQSPSALAVEVTNASEPVLCAEKDNVTINLASRDVRRFRIEAAHPAYIGSIQRDSFEADWTGCAGPGDPTAAPTQPPKRTTLYEQIDLWVVGLTFPTFWRAGTATVRIADRVEKGLHLIQVWMIRPMGGEEVLVLYPQDGYWRARPLPPVNLKWSAYGSSFLVGPVEFEQRPLVNIREVVFDPNTRSFRLQFARGGAATLRLETLDQDRQVLDVTLDPVGDLPFAALRSMFVTEINNDVAHLGWRVKGGQAWECAPIMDFKRASAVEVWAGRLVPSRHNTSAPDTVFRDFRGR